MPSGAAELPAYDAVVLAGGRARRLGGQHKPGLVVGGRTVLRRVCDAVDGAGRLIVVGPSAGVPQRAITAREDPPGSGPVPALGAGLRHVTAPWLAVLAADLPFLRQADIADLLAAALPGRGAVLIDEQGREQWLAGIWRVAALTSAIAGYTGSSLGGLLAPLRPAPLHVTVVDGTPSPWFDCDTAADVEKARTRGEQSPQ